MKERFQGREGGSYMRRWAKSFLQEIGYDPKWIEDYLLALSEAYNNEWEHGHNEEIWVEINLVDNGRRLSTTLYSKSALVSANRVELVDGILRSSGYTAPNGRNRGMGWHLITMLIQPEVVLVAHGTLVIIAIPVREGNACATVSMTVMAPEEGRHHVVDLCDN